MQHRKLNGIMTPLEEMANVAASAAQSARESTTRQSGTISVPNADGTRSIIGVQTGDRTIATHVGDTVAPPKPDGIFAASSADVVYVAWDGTLMGETPADFSHVTVYIGVGGQSSMVGTLTESGIVSTPPLPTAQSIDVWATSEDDACKEDGTPAHNVSPDSVHQSVAIEHGSNPQGVDELKKLIAKKVDIGSSGVSDLSQAIVADADGLSIGKGTGIWQKLTGSMMAFFNAAGEQIGTIAPNLVELGKSSIEAIIKMCGGVLTISGSAVSQTEGGMTETNRQILISNNSSDVILESRHFSGQGVDADSSSIYLKAATNKGTSAMISAFASDHGVGSHSFVELTADSLSLTSPSAAIQSQAIVTTAHLINLFTATPWKDLGGVSGGDYVRYKQVGAEAYISVDVAGADNLTLTPKLPKGLRPENNMYLPAATYPGGRSALVWLGSDGSVWITGAQSSTDRVVTTVPFPIKE